MLEQMTNLFEQCLSFIIQAKAIVVFSLFFTHRLVGFVVTELKKTHTNILEIPDCFIYKILRIDIANKIYKIY